MVLDVREYDAEQINPLVDARVRLFSVRHRVFSGKSPKADLRVDLKQPPLAVWRDRVIHLLDLRRDAPRLLAQSSSRDSTIRGTGSSVIALGEGCAAGSGKYARTAWLSQQLSCCFV